MKTKPRTDVSPNRLSCSKEQRSISGAALRIGGRGDDFRKRGRIRFAIWVCGAAVLIAALGVTFWIRRFHRYTPIELVEDVRAGIASRHAAHPVEKFLELRYGPMTEAGNRQKAFLEFFNVGHIEGLHLLVSHMTPEEKKANISAMAQWLADYRGTLSSAEKEALNAYLRSDAGRATIQQATAQYLKQDVYYRAATAPVIAQMMTTLATVQKP